MSVRGVFKVVGVGLKSVNSVRIRKHEEGILVKQTDDADKQ